jgi:hypothetical protein
MALRAPAMPGCRETLPFSDVSDHREMEPKWNASGSTTHLIGTRHRKPGVNRAERFGKKRTGSRIRHSTGDGYADA